MKKGNKIVRTKTIHGSENKPNEMYYEINFMTFSEYVYKSNPEYKYINHKFELYPYKWYDIRWIYQIPAYYLLLLLNKYLKNAIQINNRNHNIASTITVISEICVLIKSIITIFNN
ncbi:hypothetical protein APS56_01260 [Pseudalgibacter alginicilyticus]|uniref:Uncharacterized protein n=1 Tax=Pseudalgibacter alginicilyticus TaxID=1736674 RepID=A0A0P0CZY9_9FLAO|nr:hypothetical protein [Pseudalgibacter alginicilyticus]ALJ03861.1 hypothetical protein APS56_01260 [Pseudalgibacter alginicilyticus]